MGYNKKILSKAVSELGKAKASVKSKDIIVDPNGYWNPDNHGKPVRVPGRDITMKGVQGPLYGIDNTGFAQMMYPGQDYQFQGDYVDEYPLTQAKKGGEKKYSRSLSATNKLFKKNPLVKKKKTKNRKTFDPNAKYYQDGGYIDDPSIPELTIAQTGGATSCPEGYSWDGTKCTLTKPDVQNLEEVVIVPDDKKKLHGNLMDKLNQVKGAYQDWREDAGLRKARLSNEGASTIEGLKTQIAEYKKQLEEEKKAYNKAGKALNVLKAKRPDEWKNAKLADVMSTKGIESLRTLYSEDKISEATFRDFYNSFGTEYDTNVAKGTGVNRQYSAKQAKQEWMENVPEFVENVGTFAKAASLAPAALVLGPALAPYGRALLPYADKAAAVAGRALSSRLVQGAFLADTAIGIPDVIKDVDRAIATGENIGEAAFDVGLTTLELILAKGPLKGALNKAADLIKPAQEVLQTPFIKNANIAKYFPNVGETAINSFKSPLGKATANAMADLTPGKLLTATGAAAGAASLPYVIEEGKNTSEILTNPDIPWKIKYEAIKRFGNQALSTGLSLAPLSNVTRPISATRTAAAYSAPLSLEKFVQGDLGSGLGMLTTGMKFINPKMAAPINRVHPFTGKPIIGRTLFDSYQKGGNARNSYETILSQNQIKELEKQGYKIEYLD
jgi:hypothetical protein